MKKILPNLSASLLLLSLFGQSAYAKDCGMVTIENILAGPIHGSMMRISNHSCGKGSGWVCLDPNGEHMSVAESQRLFSFVLSMYLHGRPVRVDISEGVYAHACNGAYPVVADVRVK